MRPTAPNGAFPPLGEPPVLPAAWGRLQPFVHPAFNRLNRCLMIPIHRAGLASEALAEEVRDPEVHARIMPALARTMGLVGLTIGVNPWTAGDEAVMQVLGWVPLVRISPVADPIEAGPDGSLATGPERLFATAGPGVLAQRHEPVAGFHEVAATRAG